MEHISDTDPILYWYMVHGMVFQPCFLAALPLSLSILAYLLSFHAVFLSVLFLSLLLCSSLCVTRDVSAVYVRRKSGEGEQRGGLGKREQLLYNHRYGQHTWYRAFLGGAFL